jgi:hypothetical protein
LVPSFLVEEDEVRADAVLGGAHSVVGVQEHLLVFQGAPQPLDEDVVQAASFAVHRDSDVRELFTRDVAVNPEVDIKAAQQFWYVCQTTYLPNGDAVSVEQRYFVTSIPTGTLTRDQELALVRMRWAIENGCNWTPCQASRASIETVSWLRIIGYNAVSAWRQQAPSKDRKPIAWQRAMETLSDALLLAEVMEDREAIQGIT